VLSSVSFFIVLSPMYRNCRDLGHGLLQSIERYSFCQHWENTRDLIGFGNLSTR
jgi:hypothetical protein